jgi:hypothetical protein
MSALQKHSQTLSALQAPDEQLPLLMDYPPVRHVPTLQKPVPVVHMYPVQGEYDLFTRRLFNVLLVETYKTWDKMTTELQAQYVAERRVLRFRSKVSDLRRQLGGTKSNRRVVQAMRKLYRLEFKFDVMEDDLARGRWKMHSRLIFQVGGRKPGAGPDGKDIVTGLDDVEDELVNEVTWEFPPDVFEMLVERRYYAQIDLMLANSWRSQFTLALYENTFRYRNNPGRLTARLPVEEWMDLIGNGSPALARYKVVGGYRYFKREMLKPAMDEMNSSEVCPIKVEVDEGWTGKRITTLQFKVIDKKAAPTQPLALLDDLATGNPKHVEQLRSFGLSEDAIKRVKRGSDSDIELAIRITRKALEKGGVESAAGFFMAALTRQFQDVETPEEVHRRKQKERETMARVEQDKELLAEAYKKHRGERTRNYFNGLLPVMKTALIGSFMAADESAPIRKLYEQKGFDNPRVEKSFFAWLAAQEGILTQPEEQSEDAFAAWHAQQHSRGAKQQA